MTRGALARHGTQAGYQRHRDCGQKPCTPCRMAHNEDKRDRRAKARAIRQQQADLRQLIHLLATVMGEAR